MDNGATPGDAQGLQEITSTNNIRVQGVDRSIETGLGIALGRQVEDVIWLNSFNNSEQRDQIIKVGIQEEYTVLVVSTFKQMLDIFDGAAPTANTVDIPVCVIQQIICQV